MRRMIAIAISTWCWVCHSCRGMTVDGIQFKTATGLETGVPSTSSFRWQTPETVTISNETCFVGNCTTSASSRISFELQNSSNEPIANCRVSVFDSAIDSENAMIDGLVFCVTLPINAYAHGFSAIRHPSGDVSVWKYSVPTNSTSSSFVARTFGNINMIVNTYTNHTSVSAEMFSEALKAACMNEIID